MSAAQKQSSVAVETEASVLDRILDQVQTIAAQQSRPSPIHLNSWSEIERFAEKAAKSGMVPKDYISKPDAIVIAVMMGSELGLAPMQALQNIAVINGRPAIWGDAMPGLIRASGRCEYIKEWSTGDGETLTFYCEAKRKDDPTPIMSKFGAAEAKRAGLWEKDLYKKYPQRMLPARARGFCLRDAFPDVLKGLISAEEAADIPFEATGLTPRMEPERPAQDPRAVDPPKTRTVSKWLDGLEIDLANAKTKNEVDAILAADDVQQAQDKLRNGAKDRLQHILDAAIKRTAEDPSLMGGEEELTSGAPWTTRQSTRPRDQRRRVREMGGGEVMSGCACRGRDRFECIEIRYGRSHMPDLDFGEVGTDGREECDCPCHDDDQDGWGDDDR